MGVRGNPNERLTKGYMQPVKRTVPLGYSRNNYVSLHHRIQKIRIHPSICYQLTELIWYTVNTNPWPQFIVQIYEDDNRKCWN